MHQCDLKIAHLYSHKKNDIMGGKASASARVNNFEVVFKAYSDPLFKVYFSNVK